MDDTALLFAGAQFSGSHIDHYKTRLTAASQQIPTPGPFFCARSRFGPRLVGESLQTPENAPVSQILTLAAHLAGPCSIMLHGTKGA